MTLYIFLCSFEEEGVKERAAKLEEENAALKERLAKALEAATHASSVGGAAAAVAVGNGVARAFSACTIIMQLGADSLHRAGARAKAEVQHLNWPSQNRPFD